MEDQENGHLSQIEWEHLTETKVGGIPIVYARMKREPGDGTVVWGCALGEDDLRRGDAVGYGETKDAAVADMFRLMRLPRRHPLDFTF